MPLPVMSEADALRERYTERWALGVCCSTTFVQCLRAFHIAPTIPVGTPKGKSITISASDIYGARKRSFSMLESDQEACRMTLLGDKCVDLYQDWLLNEHTDRYRSITLDAHRKWLRQVIILVVARHLMEQKYALYITQGSHTFADVWACSEMCRLQLLNNLTSELARLVHHIMRDPEQQQALIDQFHTDLEIRMKGQLFAAPDPLQALPEPFDFSTLDEQTRELVMRKTDETRGLMMRTTEHIIAIGENLLVVQKQLPEMKFSAWLRTEFALS